MAQTSLRSKRSTADGGVRMCERAIRRKVVEDGKGSGGSPAARKTATTAAPTLGEPVAGFAVGCPPGALPGAACVQLSAPTTGSVLRMPTFPTGLGAAGWGVPPYPCPPPPAFMLFMMQQHMQRMQQMALSMGWAHGAMPGMPTFPPIPPVPGSFPAMPCMPGATPSPVTAMPGAGLLQAEGKGMPYAPQGQFGTGAVPFAPAFPVATSKGALARADHMSAHSGSAASTGPADSGNSNGTLLEDCTDTEFHTFISSFLQPGSDDTVIRTGDPVLDLPLDLDELVEVRAAPASPVNGGALLGSFLDNLDKAGQDSLGSP